MAVKSSGSLSLITDIVGEFSGTAPHGLKEYYSGGTYVPSSNTGIASSGPISMLSFYGSTNIQYYTITSSTPNLNLATYLTGLGWSGGPVDLTINSGVYLWSDSTSTAGLIISSAFSNLLTITNNGFIMGKGGQGGYRGTAPTAGGPAISNSAAGVTMNLTSTGYVGGGGGGGAGGLDYSGNDTGHGGGGAGGGNGGGALTGRLGGAGGAIGQAGARGGDSYGDAGYGGGAGGGGAAPVTDNGGGGGGGGRIMPGTGGAGGNAGSGMLGGAGGSAGGAGGNAVAPLNGNGGGGGGGWGAAGGKNDSGTAGGAGGKAVTGTAITFTGSTSHVYGANG